MMRIGNHEFSEFFCVGLLAPKYTDFFKSINIANNYLGSLLSVNGKAFGLNGTTATSLSAMCSMPQM